MNILNFALLIFTHYLLGWGILRAIGFKNITTSIQFTLVSFILGEGFSSLIPVIMEMLSLSITKSNLALAIAVASALPFVFWIKSLSKAPFASALKGYSHKVKLYDILFFCLLLSMLYVSFFKCYYFPGTPRDLLSGPEAIAEYTLKEHRINNSYFTVDLTSTDNYQKPPYLLGLQIIYKSFVQPFGHVWLIPLVFAFFTLFYVLASKVVHPVLAGIATILVLANPEFFGYTIMVLFDFSNTVSVFIGFYYLYQFLKNNDRKYLLLSATGFGLATLARPETIFLVVFTCMAYCIRELIRFRKGFVKTSMITCLILLSVPLLVDVFTMEIFIKKFIPSDLNIGGKFNKNLTDLSPFFQRLYDIVNLLMFTDKTNPKVTYLSSGLYSETFDILLLFIILELGFSIYNKKIGFNTGCWFLFIFMVYITLGFIGYLIPWADIPNNAKRGLFKMIPLTFFFVILTRPIQLFSNLLIKWERK